MKKIRFVFYRAKFDLWNVIRGKRKLHLIDDGISLWTWFLNMFTPPYSHMSVWEPSDSAFHGGWKHYPSGIFDSWVFFGTCYTSTMRGKDNGTVSRPASEVFTHPERWEYIEFEVTDESFEQAKAWADDRVKNNKGYSMRDLLRFAMPLWMLKGLKIADPDREICSEHGEGWATRLKRKWFPETHRIENPCTLLDEVLIRSPRRLWRDLTKRNRVATYSLASGKRVRGSNGKKVK